MLEPLYQRGTRIEGYFPDNYFDSISKETETKLSMEVLDYFNAKLAPWKIKSFPIKPEHFIILEEEFVGNVGDYMETEKFSERFIRGFERHKMIKTLGFLFPHHNLAFILDYKLRYTQTNLELEKLGYKIVYKNRRNSRGDFLYSCQWNDENKIEFLKVLRSREYPEIRALDSRAEQIISILKENINSDIYQFAEFIPKESSCNLANLRGS